MFKNTKIIVLNAINYIFFAYTNYSPTAIALMTLIELVWVASVLVPVLFVLSTFNDFLKVWLAILPGFWGMATFLLILTVGGFVAYLPSTYVARLREHLIEKIARKNPLTIPVKRNIPLPAVL
jgi:hypothetical protein